MRLQPEITPGLFLPARLPRGFALGDVVVDDWVRDGATAAIYRGRRSSDGRAVAVKLQLSITVHDPLLGERFEQEAEVLWRVRGTAHVVELLDVGLLDDGRRYLVMEWVEGEDLDDMLEILSERDQLLPVIRACRIGRDVARGLATLHQHGVVHLDLEPANVIVGHDAHGHDRVVLVDFASAVDVRATATRGTKRRETLEDVAAHVSPEQAYEGAASASCDAFSLGALMFEMVSGACAPPESWPLEALPQLDMLRYGVPPALAELVSLCMSREIERRPSMRAVASVLEAIVLALESSERESERAAGPGRAASPPEADAGDTLLGIPVRNPVVRPAPARQPVDNEVESWTRLTAANQAPKPTASAPAPDERAVHAGDTEVAMRLPAAPIDSGDTEVAMQISLAISDPSLRPDDTWELVPAPRAGREVDLEDTEVAMRMPEEPSSPEDTASSTLVLAPEDGSPGLALMAPGPLDSVADEVRYEEQSESHSSKLEWFAKERWWSRWAVAAGVLAVLGGTGAWLVMRDADEAPESHARMLAATPAAIAADATHAPQATASARATEDEANWGSKHERERMEAQAATAAATLEPAPAVVEDAREETPMLAEPPVSDATETEHAGKAEAAGPSEEECTQARARADASKRERAWSSVLKATRKRGCWTSPEQRVVRSRLRVTALAELGRLEQCVEEGAKSRDREVAARTALCRKKLEEA